MFKYYIERGTLSPKTIGFIPRTFVSISNRYQIPEIVKNKICRRFPVAIIKDDIFYLICEDIYTNGITLTDDEMREILLPEKKQFQSRIPVYENTERLVRESVENHRKYLQTIDPVAQFINREQYQREFLTISLGFPRQTSKTTSILKNATKDDVIIVRNYWAKRAIEQKTSATVIHLKSGIEDLYVLPDQVKQVWLDEVELTPDIYASYPNAERFIRIGTF